MREFLDPDDFLDEDQLNLAHRDNAWDRLPTEDRFADQDRLAEKAPARFAYLAYTERPSDRERREHYDETRAATELYPRRSDSQVTGLGRKAA